MAITPGEIKALALAEDDFAHEMRVGAVLHSAPDSIVLHAGTYIDGVTGKPRQFDYRFRMRYEAQSQCLQLAVECKNLQQDSPLVVCGYARRDSEAFHDVIESRIGTFRKGNATMAGLSSVTRRADLHTTVYRANEFVGKNLLRIKSEKNGKYSVVPDSDVYEKWSQALSSSEELCERAKRFSQDFKQEHVYSIIIPAVVVPDGSLWMMEYDPSGTPIADPRQLEACEFFVGRTWVIHPPGTPAFQEVCLSHIQFFTLSGLRKFVDRLQGQGFWNAMFPSPVMPGPEASR